MLLVTTTVRMLDGVHCHTSNSWPVLSLSLVLVPRPVGLKQGLVSSLATGDNTDHGSAGSDDGLSGTGWESESSLLLVLGVTDDDSRSAGSSGERASVSLLALDVGNDGSFGEAVDWENVSDREGSYTINLLLKKHGLKKKHTF